MSDLQLYFISGSPPCWTVMLALAAKGLDYTPMRLDNAKREQKSPEYLAINPRGHVPVIVDGDVTVAETLAVLNYIDRIAPEPPLFGTDAAETGRVWQMISECDAHLRERVTDISRPLFRGKSAEFADQISAAGDAVRQELAVLEAKLETGNWLAGDRLSAADLTVYPVVMQLGRALSRDEASAFDLGLHPLETAFPALAAWRDRIEALPGYDTAYPPHWKKAA